MSTRQILGAVGAAVGGFFFGPQGAQWGWAIGSTVGGAVDPEVIKGPSVGDIAAQTSQEGTSRPIVFALSQPMAGNIIASGEVRIVKRRESQGKGGPKVETESAYRTYAIGVCEGPISGFARVWRNQTLVYDDGSTAMSAGNEFEFLGLTVPTGSDNAKFLKNARFFLGSYTQNPSPDLEAIFGVGTTPAHRGTAYMVMADEDLTDLRGAIPQWTFQVRTCASDTVLLLQAHTGALIESTGVPEVAVFDGEGVSGIFTGIAKFGIASYHNQNEFVDHTNFVDAIDDVDLGRFIFNDEFTFEGWFYRVSDGGGDLSTLFANSQTQQNGFFFLGPKRDSFGNGLVFKWDEVDAVNHTISADDLPMLYDQWYHIAVTRDSSNVIRIFLNGQPSSSTKTFAGPIGGVDQFLVPSDGFVHFTVGEGIEFVSADFDGYWDQVRATKACLYTGAFAVPTAPFTAGGSGTTCTMMLSDIVTEICERAGLPSSLIDVSELDEIECHGLTVTNLYPAFAALRSLSEIFFFDCTGIDGKVHFRRRGANTVATITEDDMLDDDADIEQERRSDPIQIPRVLHLNYYDVAGGLATNKQSSERAGDRRATGESSLQSAVMMSSTEAAHAVAINHTLMTESQRGELKFCLPDKFIRFVPTNPIFVQWQGRTTRALMIKVEANDGFQEYALLHDRQSSYVSNVEPFPISPPSDPVSSVVGPTVIVPLDIHILKDADDAEGLIYYVAITGLLPAWTGALVELSYDNGANYVDAASTDVTAIIGELTTTLGDHPAEFPDEVNTCSVVLHTPLAELQSATLENLLNRANLAIVGDEIIQFGNAEETTAGQWELSYFIRGRKGTATSAHAIGEPFVLLDVAQLTLVHASLADIGRTLTFRATSFGDDTPVVVSMLYSGKSQTEREPGYVMARRDGTDAVVTWQGVGRLGAGASTAHGQRFDGYRVTFDDGTNPVITVNTDAQTVTQSIAALGSPVTIGVVQLNELTGAGPEIEVIIS